MSEILTKERRGRIAAEIARRIEASSDDADVGNLWRFVRGIVEDYEATVENVESLAVMVRRDVEALQAKLTEQREVLRAATRCRLCDGQGEYQVPSGEPGKIEMQVCLLCDFNGRRVDLLHSFLVDVHGAESRIEVPQDSIEVVEDLVARAGYLLKDPVYNMAELARGGGDPED